MEVKFLSSFLIIITTAVNLKVTLSASDARANCTDKLAIEIWEPPEPLHCKGPSQGLMVLVEFGHAHVYLNETTCEEITFKCTLNRPLTWNYDGVGMPAIEYVKLISDFHDDCYTAFISVQVGPHVPHGKTSIGRYTCSSLNAHDNQTDYVQIFKADMDQIAIVPPAGITRNVSYDGSNELVIPCMTNWPYVHPTIMKETVDGLVQINQSRYNSATGFHLQFDTKNPSDALGTYLCEMGPEANGSRAVFKVQENGDLDKPTQSEQIVIAITRYETCSRFTCEAVSKLEHELAFFPCQNIKHCEYQIRYAQLAVQFPEVSTSQEICDDLDALPGGLVRPKNRTGIVICREKGGNKYNFAHHYQLVKASPVANHEGRKSIEPQREESIEGTIDASVLDQTYFVNDILKTSTCYISEFVYAERPMWLVGLNGSTVKSWGNVTVSRQEDITVLHHTIDINSTEIQSLICAAPRWDTDEWANLTFPLEVKSGTPPQLFNSSAPTLYANGSEKADFIFFQYTGEPTPGTICTQDGKLPWGKRSYTIGYNKGDALISLKGEAEKVKGLYECVVRNVAGSVTIKFNVVLASLPPVQPTTGKSLVIAVSTPSTPVQPTTGKSPVIVALISLSLCALIVLSLVVLGKKMGISKTKWWQKIRFCLPLRRGDSPIGAGDLSLGTIQGPSDKNEDVPEDSSCPRGTQEVEAIIQSSFTCSVVKPEDLSNMKRHSHGTFGIVYTIHKDDGRAFALKIMRNDGSIYSTQFLREIETLDFLGRHENILGFQGLVKQEGVMGDLFIVTDFCWRGDIGTFLEKRKANFRSTVLRDQVVNPPRAEKGKCYVSADAIFDFTTIDFIHWAVDCATGMEFMASNGYAHGDLAPRNLLLADDGKVKICDFGLSRPLQNENGTPCYLLSNKSSAVPWDHYNLEFFETEKITTLTDIWAYGVTMWEIFELGKKPFAKKFKKYDKTYVKALKTGLRLLKPKYATTRIYEIMSSCWDRDPRNRPSFKELGELFQAQLPTQPDGGQANRGDYVLITFVQDADENSSLQSVTTENSFVNAIRNQDGITGDSMSTAIKLSTSTSALT